MSGNNRPYRLLSLLLTVAMIASIAPVGLVASSWDPTLLVNTESFQIIDEGDGSSDIYLQFGDTVAETLTWSGSTTRFIFSDNVNVRGTMSGTSLLVTGSGNVHPLIDTSDGMVGIGTESPGFMLDVMGNIGPASAPVEQTITRTIQQLTDTENVGLYTSVEYGADGLPIIAYYNVTDTDLMVTKCGNAACTSGNKTTQIADADAIGIFADIAIGADGLPVIAHQNTTDGDLMITKCGTADCSSGNTSEQVAGPGGDNVGQWASIAIGTDGNPVISHYNGTDGDVMITHCSDPTCSADTSTQITDAGNIGLTTAIAIGIDGLPIVSYADLAFPWDLQVTKCGNTTCSAGNTTTQIATASILDGLFSSIAIRDDGMPLIAYNDLSGGVQDLVVLSCTNASCSTSTRTTVPHVDVTGFWTSIDIAPDGLPVIAHQNTTDNDLMVTKCDTDDCTGTNTTTQFADVSNVGAYTSIAIGSDSLPIISYQNTTATDVMFLRCADDECSAASADALTGGYDLGSPSVPFSSLYTHAIENPAASGSLVFRTNGIERALFTSSGHFLPSQNVTYDLGSATNRWRDLYLSGGTIRMGAAGNEGLFGYNGTRSAFTFDADADGNIDVEISSGSSLELSKDGQPESIVTAFSDNGGSSFTLRRARGTEASPAALEFGNVIGGFVGRGFDGSSFSPNRTSITFHAADNWTGSKQGSEIRFNVTQSGTTTGLEAMRITGDGRIGINETNPETMLDVQGAISGTTLTASALRGCDSIDTDSSGNLICGTDASGYLAPYIGGVTPIVLPINTAGQILTVTGGNLDVNTVFDLGANITITNTQIDSHEQATLTVTTGAAQQFQTVTATNGSVSNFGTARVETKNVTILIPGSTATWVRISANVTTGVGSLAATTPLGWSKAASFGTVPAGTDMTLTFQLTSAISTSYAMFGVDNSDPNTNYTTIDYAVYLANGTLYVFENGSNRGSFGSYAVNDTFQVKRTGTTITYHRNGNSTPFYTSAIASSSSLVFDSSIYGNTTINNIQITY